MASRDYFRTVRLPLVAGRLFTPRTARRARAAILASRSAAAKFFPAGDAIGQRLRFGARPGNVRLEGEIVGIVGDVHDQGLDQGLVPEFYASLEQAPVGAFSVVLRSAQEPGQPRRRPCGARSRRSMPSCPSRSSRPMRGRSSRARSRGPRFTMSLLLAFAAIALAARGRRHLRRRRLRRLAAHAARSGSAWRSERDARNVRGARAPRRAAPRARRASAWDCAPRSALTRLLRGLLFEVPPTDLATLAGVAVVLLAAALAACWIPARRASRLDPLKALRAN